MSGPKPQENGARQRSTGLFRALSYRNYRLFFFGQSISLIGTWMQQVAMSWLVYRLTGSALLLGTVGFTSQIPTFVVAPFAGVLADRGNRRLLLIATQSLAMTQAFLLSWFVLSGSIRTWHIIVLSLLLGVVNGFDIPIRQSFVIEMVEERHILSNAIALNSSMVNAARLLGPSIAGILIAATGEGLLIVDQHALHERLLHDRIERRLAEAPLETQRLLVPVTVDLSPAEFAIVQSSQGTLARLGVEVEHFGGTTVALRAFPALLGRADPATVVHDLLAAAAQGDTPDQAALVEKLVNVMACHGAVRAGQPLADPEVRELLSAVTSLGDRDTCPHGRPTVLRLTRADLERQFRRT